MRDREKERNIRLPESYVQQGGPRASAASLPRPPRRPRPGPEPPRGKRQRRRPVLRRVLLGVLCLFLAACLSVGGYLYASTRNDFLWLDLEQLPHREATILYAQDRETGEWVEYARLEATQQKIWVPLSEIPEDMQHAFVAIEDKHFYEHHGRFPHAHGVRGAQRDEKGAHRNLFRQRHQAGRLHHRPAAHQEPDAGRRGRRPGGLYAQGAGDLARLSSGRKVRQGDHPGGIPQRHKLYRQHGGRGGRKHQAVRKIRQGLISGPSAPPSPPSPKTLTGTTRAPMKKSI